jgi:hypothetical protein
MHPRPGRSESQWTPSPDRHWSAEAPQYGNQSGHFWKDVSIKGGLILLFITGAGRHALDHLPMERRPVRVRPARAV